MATVSGARPQPSVGIALWVLATLATAMFLRVAYELAIPIVIGILLSLALNPVVGWLERIRVPRLVGSSLVLLVLTAALAFGIYSLRDEAAKVLDGVPRAARQMRDALQSGGSDGLLAKMRRAAGEVQRASAGAGGAGGSGDSQPPGGTGASQTTSGGNMLARGSSSLLTFAGHMVVVFFLVFFLLIGGPAFHQRIVAAAGPNRRTTGEILNDINWQVQRFLLVRAITSVVVGVATWIVLLVMGVQQAAFWGVLAGVFNSIPYFGPIIVSGGLAIVGLIQFGDFMKALQIAAAAMVITSLEGWLLTPPLMGKAARMNAITVFIGLLVWSWIWGIWGTILAVPMLATIKAAADHIDALKPLGRLMGE